LVVKTVAGFEGSAVAVGSRPSVVRIPGTRHLGVMPRAGGPASFKGTGSPSRRGARGARMSRHAFSGASYERCRSTSERNGWGLVYRRIVLSRPRLAGAGRASRQMRWSPLGLFRASTATDRQLGGRSLQTPRLGSGTPN
jgi:hypothetical protein